MKKLIAQGAEAKIYLSDKRIIKERIKKNYRISEIDIPLRTRRTKREVNLLSKAQRAGIPVPKVLDFDKESIQIEYLNGPKVRDYLNKNNAKKVCKEIGNLITKMHNANIIHADLTTSNMVVKNKKIYFIDFGLGEFSKKIEDKAVDLHLFKECLVSKHHEIWEICWEAFLSRYSNKDVLERLKIVESRGRYKHKT